MNRTRIILLLAVAALIGIYLSLDAGRYLTLENVQQQLSGMQQFAEENFIPAAALYLSVYVLFTLLSIPGALLLTLLGGAVFGLVWGTVLVSFASSLGATGAFLLTRLLLRDWVQRRFGDYLAPINRGIERDGVFFLFSIRMVPLFPFFMVNLLAGLTPLRLRDYYLATQSGMLLATIVFVNAGAELAQLETLSGLVSGSVLLSFSLLGLLPLIAKFLVDALRRKRLSRRFPVPHRFDANVVVIGGGSAGLVASLIVAGSKAKVILVEQERMGGDCLNTGCVPSKTLLRSARIAAYIRRAGEFGVRVSGSVVDFPAVMQRVRAVITQIEPHDSIERFTSLGVECISGKACITSPYVVEVNGRSIATRSIIIATGARPLIPEIPGLNDTGYLTTESIWNLEVLPRRLLILGGGPVGCEMAQAFQNLGSSVTLLEQAGRLLPREDSDASDFLTRRLQHDGVTVITGVKVDRFVKTGHEMVALGSSGSASVAIGFDCLLLALGRRPNVTGLGLEALEIPLTGQGSVEVNEFLQTRYPNILACGDVAGPYQFTHMASYQAWYAALNSLLGGLWRKRVNYRVVPWVTFTTPEVARVGVNEQDAASKGIAYELTRFELSNLDRAIAEQEAGGFLKVLTVPGKDQILGVTIVGHHAGELLAEFVFAMTHGLGLRKIAAVTHVYPTLSEANRFVANRWRSARLPVRWMPVLEKYFRRRRGEKT